MLITLGLVAFGGAIAQFIYSFLSSLRRANGVKPFPGPKGLPIVGNIFDMPKNPQLIPLFNDWHQKYGSIVQFSVLGLNQVVLNTEKAVNDLFVRRGQHYSDRGIPTAVADGIAKGRVAALMDRSETWRSHRKLIHAILSAPATTRHEPAIELETLYTLVGLLDDPESYSAHIERYSFGVIFRVCLGRKLKDINDFIVQESIKSTGEVLSAFRPDKFASNIWPALLNAPDWLVPSNKKLKAYVARLQNIINIIRGDLKEDMDRGTAPDSLQKWFLEHIDEFEISEEHGAWIFQAFLSAGTRSPYNVVMQYMINVMEHPEWQQKVQEEIDAVVGKDRLPRFDDVPNLPTVRAVIKEALRHRSLVAEIGIPHKLDKDDFYEGHFIPKGTLLHANYSAIVSDRALYPDGPVYNPARWLDPSFPTYKEPLTTYPTLMNYTSFGYGRRACPGTYFTERILTIMVARLAWGFNVKKKVDPKTNLEIPLDIKYEPTPNPKPFPFPAVVEVRDEGRMRVIRREGAEGARGDPLGKQRS